MVTASLQGAIRRLTGPPRINYKRLRQLPRYLSSGVTFHQVNSQIPPGHPAPGTGNVAVHRNQLVRLQIHRRETLPELMTKTPMCRRLTPVQQPRFGKHECTGTVTGYPDLAGV